MQTIGQHYVYQWSIKVMEPKRADSALFLCRYDDVAAKITYFDSVSINPQTRKHAYQT